LPILREWKRSSQLEKKHIKLTHGGGKNSQLKTPLEIIIRARSYFLRCHGEQGGGINIEREVLNYKQDNKIGCVTRRFEYDERVT